MGWLSVLLYLIPVVLCGYWLRQRGRLTAALPAATAHVQAALAKRGLDATQPTSVTFLLSFHDQADAERAAHDLPSNWATMITQFPAQHRWACRATATMLLTPSELSARAQELDALALRHHGAYDGWEPGA